MPYIIAALAIVVVGVGFTLFQSQQNTEVATIETPATTEQVTVPTASDTASAYTDGTYKTDVTYMTPKRDEYLLNVSLTLANGIVTDSAITYTNGAELDPNAQKFEAAYKAEIIGKNIDSLNLARVGGASLTTGAFNEALASIKTDAKS